MPVRDSRVDEKEWIPLGQLERGGTMAHLLAGRQHDLLRVVRGRARLYLCAAVVCDPTACGRAGAVQHLHETNAYGHPHGMAVGADKIVLLMNQGSSNIWLMSPRR